MLGSYGICVDTAALMLVEVSMISRTLGCDPPGCCPNELTKSSVSSARTGKPERTVHRAAATIQALRLIGLFAFIDIMSLNFVGASIDRESVDQDTIDALSLNVEEDADSERFADIAFVSDGFDTEFKSMLRTEGQVVPISDCIVPNLIVFG